MLEYALSIKYQLSTRQMLVLESMMQPLLMIIDSRHVYGGFYHVDQLGK